MKMEAVHIPKFFTPGDATSIVGMVGQQWQAYKNNEIYKLIENRPSKWGEHSLHWGGEDRRLPPQND